MNELPVPVPTALVAAIVRGARQGHLIAARTHNNDELWDEATFGVNRYRLSVNWIMQEADGIARVTAQSDKGGGKHLCCNGLRHSFHNGGTNANWDPNTYDFDRSDARRTMATNNGQLSMLDDLAGEAEQLDLARVRELDVLFVGNAMSGCEMIYLGAPVDSDIGPRWGWITVLWSAAGDHEAAGPDATGSGTSSRHPVGPAGGYEGFRSMPEEDVPPLTVRPTVRPAEQSGS